MFQSNILSSVYIDDYILIHGPMFDNSPLIVMFLFLSWGNLDRFPTH